MPDYWDECLCREGTGYDITKRRIISLILPHGTTQKSTTSVSSWREPYVTQLLKLFVLLRVLMFRNGVVEVSVILV